MAGLFGGYKRLYGGYSYRYRPISLACWGRSSSTLSQCGVATLGSDTGFMVGLIGIMSGQPARFHTGNLAGGRAHSTVGYTVGQYHHFGGANDAGNNRKVLLDGGAKGTSTKSASVVPWSRVQVADAPDLDAGSFDGVLSMVAMWDVDLTDVEFKQLAKGVSPWRTRPQNLRLFMPLDMSVPELLAMDFTGRETFTLTGTPNYDPVHDPDRPPVTPFLFRVAS